MIGEALLVSTVMIAGAYDLYGRGRVSTFLKSFKSLNIDGKDVDAANISNFQQSLDMRHAAFTASFDYADKASVNIHCLLNGLSLFRVRSY